MAAGVPHAGDAVLGRQGALRRRGGADLRRRREAHRRDGEAAARPVHGRVLGVRGGPMKLPLAPAAAGPVDPVCGMTVSDDSPYHHDHAGRTYYFCCDGCQKRFAADPEQYLAHQPAEHAHAPAAPPEPSGTIYTCPMHPEVRQDHPGACPKCGMALEPEMPRLDEAENPELISFRRRFWLTLPLTLIVTVLAM